MSRFSLSSTLALFQSVAAADSDATSSSTSSNSLVNTSSGSLSVAPSFGGGFGASTGGLGLVTADGSLPASRYEQQIHESTKITNFNRHQEPNISNHLLELQREIKEEEEEIFANINSLINNRSNLYSSFEDDTDEFEDTINGGGRNGSGFGRIVGAQSTPTITNTSISCHPFSITKNDNNDIARHRDNSYFHQDEDQGLGNESDHLIGDEDNLGHHQQHPSRFLLNTTHNYSDEGGGTSNNNQYHHEHKYAPCNRFTDKLRKGLDDGNEEEETRENNLEEPLSDCELQGQQQHQYLELDSEQIHEQDQLEKDDYQAIQRDFHHLTSNLPKPCVFFLEGNCRRSDCKYSHDLSSITCKYWIEGFCFKGEMCPFLHSFASKGQDSGLLDDDLALAKRELNPTFVIESEADFPSLPLDAPDVTLSPDIVKDIDATSLTKTIKNQILSSNSAVVFKTTKKKRKKG